MTRMPQPLLCVQDALSGDVVLGVDTDHDVHVAAVLTQRAAWWPLNLPGRRRIPAATRLGAHDRARAARRRAGTCSLRHEPYTAGTYGSRQTSPYFSPIVISGRRERTSELEPPYGIEP